MKKTFFFLVVLFIACFSQAAQLDWRFYGPESITGNTVYIVTNLVPTSITSISDITDYSKGSGTLIAHYTDSGNYSDTFGTINQEGLLKYYFFVTQVIDDKTYYWKSAYQETDLGGPTTEGKANNFNVDGLLDTTLGDISNWTQITADVPEPTTLALLALGIAALGLKRKV